MDLSALSGLAGGMDLGALAGGDISGMLGGLDIGGLLGGLGGGGSKSQCDKEKLQLPGEYEECVKKEDEAAAKAALEKRQKRDKTFGIVDGKRPK